MSERFLGKYRGVVTDNDDPEMIGRIRATVADVTGRDECGWADPCTPFGGPGSGLFALPEVGAGVWIEYENGDPELPIWTGCWRGSPQEVPTSLLVPSSQPGKVMLLSQGGHSILLDDTPGSGGITLKTAAGAKIAITGTGIEIASGGSPGAASIKLVANAVSVNGGALEVI